MAAIKSAVLGYPRIGPKREVKKVLFSDITCTGQSTEAYWQDKISAEQLLADTKAIRVNNWKTLKHCGVDIIPSNEFTLYDHVLDTSVLFNVIPEKYANAGLSELDLTFAMGRGRQRDGVDVEAQEMKKWFDSNYHYIVPELSPSTQFKLNSNRPVEHFLEAKEAGVITRPVLLGPISYLLLGKNARNAPDSFKPIDVLDKLVPAYAELLKKLADAGATEVQIDEPTLVLDSTKSLGNSFKSTYTTLGQASKLSVTLATYFGRLEDNVNFLKDLPISALHIDLDRAPEQLDPVVKAIQNTKLKLSLGVVSGRNIWKTDLSKAIKTAKDVSSSLGQDRVIVSTSSSLLHIPVTLSSETQLSPEVKDWFSFAVEKASEISLIARALAGNETQFVKEALQANAESIKARRDFESQSDPSVRDRLAGVTDNMYNRKSPFATRQKAQGTLHKLPRFPTTTIGSFPQTKEIRQARARLGKGEINENEYNDFIAKEIESVIRFQENAGLDILVHGEPERNDMVQYFGEKLKGFVFTENAWVQSYGSRYVRPPIVVSDVSRPEPMTVKWSSYAQSLTKVPVKGMLTGPVTILNWSFPRADVSKELQSKQLALALRDEVVDLAKAGIFAIQVDEPAIREGLPLRRSDWDKYLRWAVDSFKLATAGVDDSTQTHSHFCYSDFNDIFDHIARLDADVISIEASKSDLKLLNVFEKSQYPNAIGPGVYDIHSPRVPPTEEIKGRISEMLKQVKPDLLYINPDCGLKTRGWPETEASLKNLVVAAKWAREQYKA